MSLERERGGLGRPRRWLSRTLPWVALVASLAGCRSAAPGRVPAGAEVRSEAGARQQGLASWYGADFAGLPTASGEIFRPDEISAAHRTLPLGTVVEVRNEKNGQRVRVRINDRGPFVAGRIVDLSRAAAKEIGSVIDGVVPVTLEVLELGSGERTPPPEPPGGWVVQAGAFGSEENARRLRDRLAERYPDPFLEEYRGLQRVKFGPYRSRGEAEKARQSLVELGLAGILVPHR